jgi:hypothetical protein
VDRFFTYITLSFSHAYTVLHNNRKASTIIIPIAPKGYPIQLLYGHTNVLHWSTSLKFQNPCRVATLCLPFSLAGTRSQSTSGLNKQSRSLIQYWRYSRLSLLFSYQSVQKWAYFPNPDGYVILRNRAAGGYMTPQSSNGRPGFFFLGLICVCLNLMHRSSEHLVGRSGSTLNATLEHLKVEYGESE